MAIRKAEAVWEGTLREGQGRMAFGTFSGPYTFGSRFEEGEGTNPEQLIGAAHAGCFAMALSGDLTRAGFPPRRIATTAEVHLEKVNEAQTITRIHLRTEADVPGIDEAAFRQHAEGARQNCPVARALKGVEITLDARLVS
jgi:osmotically inducible protein OsmC